MKIGKRLERQSERLKVEQIKLLLLIDDLQKELNELSPGATVGERGMQLANAIKKAKDADVFLTAAYETLDEIKAL